MNGNKYSIGDHVVYGSSGVCLVSDITEMKISVKTSGKYYVLKELSNSCSTVYVPLDNEKLCDKMRDVFTSEQINSILCEVKNDSILWIEDRAERSEKFHRILCGGVSKELILMIACIYLKKQQLASEEKKLSLSDENMLKNAERLIKDEFSYALSIPPEKVGDYIRRKIGASN